MLISLDVGRCDLMIGGMGDHIVTLQWPKGRAEAHGVTHRKIPSFISNIR